MEKLIKALEDFINRQKCTKNPCRIVSIKQSADLNHITVRLLQIGDIEEIEVKIEVV